MSRLPAPARRVLPLVVLLVVATAAMTLGILLGRGRDLPVFQERRLRVVALNVGMGEASWVRTPGGKVILLGGGPPGMGSRVVRSLRAGKVERIDVLIVPQAAPAAVGGLPDVLSEFPVELVLEAGGPAANPFQEAVRRFFREQRIPVRLVGTGDVVTLDGARIEILAPAANSPDRSLVVSLRWGDTRLLWAGGLTREGETALLSRLPDLDSDWLRVAGFGAADATSPEFLRLVSPEFAVLSVGPNGLGLPAPATVDRLEAAGVKLFRTDEAPASGAGADEIDFFSDGIRVSPAEP